jgi:hypothetical protein
MKFDWYAATVPGVPPMEVLEAVRRGLNGSVTEGRRRLGYAQSFRIEDRRGDLLAEVLAGSVGRNDLAPHAVATGEKAQEFSRVLREAFPEHRVSRFDAAEDFDEPGAFAGLTNVMGEIALANRVKGLWITPDDPEDGATYYLGGKSSAVTCRAYQKGLQVRKSLHPALRPQVSADWARLEVQVRPPKQMGKALAASLTPEQAWGFAAWSQALVLAAINLEIPRVEGLGWQPQSDDDRAMDWLCRQYGPLLGRVFNDLGSWECVGLQIGDRLAELARLSDLAVRSGTSQIQD